MLKTKAKVDLKEDEIVAVHRIPGKKDDPRPILLKVKNNSIKTRIMVTRPIIKKAKSGKNFLRLADDVTRLNSKLIQDLVAHDDIEQAWYFNCNVYGKTTKGRRLQFDIFDNIGEKIKKAKPPAAVGQDG